ncbi:MAG TPA: hypothetical protein VE466_17100, partial [Acidimicrobiales bacterium]|nr:hypothetical protein [Acidimicrobiales bacterium]
LGARDLRRLAGVPDETDEQIAAEDVAPRTSSRSTGTLGSRSGRARDELLGLGRVPRISGLGCGRQRMCMIVMI